MHTVTYSWYELREKYLSLTDKFERSRTYCIEEGIWSGASYEDACKWIKQGYDLESHSSHMSVPSMTVDKPRWIYSDDSEGEFNYDLYAMGETEYFLSRTPRPQRAGIKVNIGYGFRADTPASTIADYGKWVGEVLFNIIAQGFDVEVNIESRNNEKLTVLIQVSRFGEQMMMNEWSAFFSPAGHRHFVFMARRMAGRKIGGSIHRGWTVKWDEKERILSFDCNSMEHGSFPIESMTDQYEKVIHTLA